ncbi:hypothetical protein COCON_G00019210, partial [Conger conger]
NSPALTQGVGRRPRSVGAAGVHRARVTPGRPPAGGGPGPEAAAEAGAGDRSLCHVQRDLYSQCFDELIRQETINCPDRGLLLQRVRDEISMCIAAYETLDESSVAFGMRKVLRGEQGKAEMEEQISVLEGQNRALQGQLQEMGAECEAVSRRELERRVTEEQKHTDEIELLKRTNQQLKFQLS